MRAAGLVRVSTGKQAKEGLSLEAMEARVRAYAESQGAELELFVEGGISASKEQVRRAGLDEILERLDEFDILIIPKLDRLTRRGPGHAFQLKDRLANERVKLVVLEPMIDFDTFAGEVVWAVLAALAKEESRQIGERVSAVKHISAARGTHLGPTPYGYTRPEGSGPLEPHPAEAAVVRRIFEESAGGKSARAIAQALNADRVPPKRGVDWSPSVVSRILRNPVYVGRIRLNGEEHAGAHEPLVAASLWQQVEQLRSARRKSSGGRGRRPVGRHLFTHGLLHCGHCGSTLLPRTADGRETYHCQGRIKFGVDYCPQTPIPREVVDSAAFDYFTEVGLDVEATKRQLAGATEARIRQAAGLREDAEREESKAQARLARVDRDYADEALTVEEWRQLRGPLQEALDGARRQKAALDARIGELTQAREVEDTEADVLGRIAELHAAVAGEVADSRDLDAVRAALSRLFERFDVLRADIAPDPMLTEELRQARDQALADLGPDQILSGCWVVVPWARPESIESLGEEWRPVLTREALLVGPTTGPSSARSSHCWAAFVAIREAS